MPLTDKQQRFAEEYVKDSNATQAAIRAGYSEKTAHSQGPRLLEKVEVRAAIQKHRGAVSKRVEIDAAWVLMMLVENVNRAMRAEPVRDKEGNETGEWTYQGAVANKALETIARHLGMFDGEQAPRPIDAHGEVVRLVDARDAVREMRDRRAQLEPGRDRVAGDE